MNRWRAQIALVSVIGLVAGCRVPQPEVAAQPAARSLGTIATTPAEGPCEGTQCISFEVESDDLVEAAGGRMVVSEPTGAMSGTIVVFSGGGGTFLWGSGPPRTTATDDNRYERTLEQWSAAGFRVVRVQWDNSWFLGAAEDEGFAALACRPATVTTWIADNLVDEGQPLCVGGGSGGAGQTSYMLTHYGLENRISLAVPWSGFWMGRIDIGCLDDDPRNEALHYGEAARRATDLTYGFPPDQDGPCFNRDPSFRSAFTESSIAAGGDLFYPNTLVWHILAGADDVGALGQGLTYYAAMLEAGSPHVRLDVLPGLPHGLTGTEAGLQKVRDAFLLECRIH